MRILFVPITELHIKHTLIYLFPLYLCCMKNYIGQALGLSALVLSFLLILSAVSKETTIAGFTLRKMDILSDIREKNAEIPAFDTLSVLPLDTFAYPATVSGDSLLAQAQIPMPEVSAQIFGQQIEDYTFNSEGLTRFFTAVDSIKKQNAKVRVAFFGDSFVEGDILLGDLRDTLQSVWGGGGVGFVPITSEIARFRRSFSQEFKGFRNVSMLQPEGRNAPLGINGYVYMGEPEAKIHYKGTSQYALKHTAYWEDVRLFYKASEGVRFVWQTEGNNPNEASLPATKNLLSAWSHSEPNITAFAARFPNTDGLLLYGASLEDGPGIYFDNFSVRGNSGGKLCHIKPEMMRAFDQYQQYDLVVLQFGLNAVTNTLTNIKWYKAELEKTFAHIRTCFPNTPILVMSVPDRGGKVDGELATMISVPYIVQMQRDLARKYGFLFYDLFRGMGGDGTMVRLSMATRPALVNKDYTHLTHEGGRMEGLRLAQMFLREREKIKSLEY